jgi:hypothetical protein
MKFLRGGRAPIVVAALFLFAFLATAQDADNQKIIEVEKAFAAQPNAGPEAAAVAKQYLFDGTLIQLTGQGQVGTLPKSRIYVRGNGAIQAEMRGLKFVALTDCRIKPPDESIDGY